MIDRAPLTKHLIGLPPSDVSIYRTISLRRLRPILAQRKLPLVAPYLWEDPFENIVASCAITYPKEGRLEQTCLDILRKPVYAQCWSLLGESDALWRIYSKVDKDPGTKRNLSCGDEGVKVKTTTTKLLHAVWSGCPFPPEDSCFLGLVQYFPEKQAMQLIANVIGKEHLNAFSGGLGHAWSLLIKRKPFEHEREVRLIVVERREGHRNEPVMEIPIDPNELFEEAILDPRLQVDDARDRETELRSLGFSGLISKSQLYQRMIPEIVLQEPLRAQPEAG